MKNFTSFFILALNEKHCLPEESLDADWFCTQLLWRTSQKRSSTRIENRETDGSQLRTAAGQPAHHDCRWRLQCCSCAHFKLPLTQEPALSLSFCTALGLRAISFCVSYGKRHMGKPDLLENKWKIQQIFPLMVVFFVIRIMLTTVFCHGTMVWA